MKKINRKNLLFGIMIPIIAIMLMGAYDVLDRYKMLKAKDIQIIDDEGRVILSLADVATILNQPTKKPVDYGNDIMNLKKQIDLAALHAW